MSNLITLPLSTVAKLFRSKELSPVDYLKSFLDRIDQYDSILNAFIELYKQSALAAAQQAEQELDKGIWKGPLHGVPVTLKDIFDIQGKRTTAHSKIQLHHKANTNATVVTKLLNAGAVIIGKTALHEFATGGPSFDLPWPPARNPWKVTHHPGGSSSGSGVSVAAGFAPVSIGTDTAGSVRNPATACGIVGMKPTYGAISKAGAFPLSFTLDHVGILTRNVQDNAEVLPLLLGKDPLDPSTTEYTRFHLDLDESLRGLKIGIIEGFNDEATAEIKNAFGGVCRAFERLGAELIISKLSPLDFYTACGRLILQAEAFSVHEQWLKKHKNDYGYRGRTRLMAGALLSASEYIHAQQVRMQLMQEFSQLMQSLDVVICVSSLTLSCAIDDEEEINRTYDRQARTPFNLLGVPAISIPMGFSESGLPLGFQIAGKSYDESTVYKVAHAYQSITDWHTKYPDLEKNLKIFRNETSKYKEV